MLLVALVALIVTLSYRHLSLKKNYKKRCSDWMYKVPNATQVVITSEKEESAEISEKVSQAILSKLEKVEMQKAYLGSDMKLVKIAQLLNTNTKYASKMIVQHRNKKSIDYINDLKIEHIIYLLRTEKKYRNYTYDSLAQEAGFGSTQNFTRAFKKFCGITPNYFISEIQKENDL